MKMKKIVAGILAIQSLIFSTLTVSAEGIGQDFQFYENYSQEEYYGPFPNAGVGPNSNFGGEVLPNEQGNVSDALSLSGGVYIPENIAQGQGVSIYGTVISGYSAITNVVVSVRTQNDAIILSKSVFPYTDSFELSAVDYAIDFSSLDAGTYKYVVTAGNNSNDFVTLTSQTFNVYAPATTTTTTATTTTTTTTSAVLSSVNPQNDNVSITGNSVIPDIKVGGYADVRGIVSSASSLLTNVSVNIYNSNNEIVMSQVAAPNATSYDISVLDAMVDFSSLPAGDYYYRVLASNASNRFYAVVNQSFRVGDTAATTTTTTATSINVFNSEPTQTTTTVNISDSLTIVNGVTVPNMVEGSPYSIRGIINSNSEIQYVTAGIFNSLGGMESGITYHPKANSFNVYLLDDFLKFGDLKPGKYVYKVTASNATSKDYVLVNQVFSIVAKDGTTGGNPDVTKPDVLSIANGVTIPTIKKGSFYSIKGTISSQTSNISSVTVGVFQGDTLITGRAVLINQKVYEVANLDEYVNFGMLPEGTFTYKVIASNASSSNSLLVSQQFNVIGSGNGNTGGVADTLTISNGVTIPNLKVGSFYSIGGTVKSASSNITSLTAGIFSMDDKLISGRIVTPDSTTVYEIATLDNYVNFGILPEGKYKYKVIASNAVNANAILVNQEFNVTASGAGNVNTNDELSILNGVEIPEIKQGGFYSIKGTINSVKSAITSVTVGIFEGNKIVTGRTANPNSNTYDISNLDPYVDFSILKAGTFNYKVIASNGEVQDKVLVNQQFRVTAAGQQTVQSDRISISDGLVMPQLMTKGSFLSVKGIVNSEATNLKNVIVGIYNTSGYLVTGAKLNPEAASCNLVRFDDYVRFNTLPAGKYHYVVMASNNSNTNVLLSYQDFLVQ